MTAAAAQDLMKLYSDRILALAAAMPHVGRLQGAEGSAMKRSPLCGSTVTVDVAMEGDRIARFGQDVKACALGQSSAAVLGAVVIGRSREEIQSGRDQL
ncbi:MAG: iron-sulfur cluster assembly scaffold protein, partial [Pseudomonadota bacterium]